MRRTIIGEVEAILHDQIGEGHFVTLFYGVLDLNSHAAGIRECRPLSANLASR